MCTLIFICFVLSKEDSLSDALSCVGSLRSRGRDRICHRRRYFCRNPFFCMSIVVSCLGNQGGFCLTPVRFAPVQLSCSSWISGFCLVRDFDFVLFVAFALQACPSPGSADQSSRCPLHAKNSQCLCLASPPTDGPPVHSCGL